MQLYKEYSKSSTSTTFQEVVNCLADAKPFYGTKLLSDLQPGFVFLIKMFISNKSATKTLKETTTFESQHSFGHNPLYVKKSKPMGGLFKV